MTLALILGLPIVQFLISSTKQKWKGSKTAWWEGLRISLRWVWGGGGCIQTLINTLLLGGSEKFQDKQMFFYNELKKHHSKQSRSEIRVNVTRFNLLNSVRTCTWFQTGSAVALVSGLSTHFKWTLSNVLLIAQVTAWQMTKSNQPCLMP